MTKKKKKDRDPSHDQKKFENKKTVIQAMTKKKIEKKKFYSILVPCFLAMFKTKG